MPKNIYFIINAVRSVPGLAYVGVPHGEEDDSPQSYTLMPVPVRKNVSNDLCDYAQQYFFPRKLLQNQSLLYLMLGLPMAHGNGPQSSTLMSGGVRKSFN